MTAQTNANRSGGAREHYAGLLASVYRWSVSANGDPLARSKTWLEQHALDRDDAGTYLDLGAGFGAHVIPLLQAGKRVTAVDFDEALLEELRARSTEWSSKLDVVAGDLVAFLERTNETWDVILCAGDTITHLPTFESVETLLRQAAQHLTPARGRLAIAWRDSTTFGASGTERFIQVARDSQRTMHCLLEPIDDEHLRVTDIVTEIESDGPRTRLSDYVKLRLGRARLEDMAKRAGLRVVSESVERGMSTLVMDTSR